MYENSVKHSLQLPRSQSDVFKSYPTVQNLQNINITNWEILTFKKLESNRFLVWMTQIIVHLFSELIISALNQIVTKLKTDFHLIWDDLLNQ